MKLYTEEQLHNTVIAVSNYLDDINLGRAQEKIEKHLKALQPIELPSDEEIEEQSWGYREVTKDMEISPNEDWSNGAKWMRAKIQGGNNEQQ